MSEAPPRPSAEQIAIVQNSWDLIIPLVQNASEFFYTTLFTLDPELRKLFPEDMAGQKAKLMAMLSLAVRGLDEIDIIAPALGDLGQRHHGYHVTTSMYDTMLQALLATLEYGMDEDFTSEVREAWIATYGMLAKTMQAGGPPH
ncbi:MAG: globin domain-containing protein [Planctomycetota bacterium]|nr:globin domain-containing protein [Planctomycetota bacterium]